MKYLRYIILFTLFVIFIIFYSKSSNNSDEYLKNNIKFEGYVTGFKQSNNHAFGIIYLKITKSNVKEFDNMKGQKIYPYRIKENVAELYTTIPDGLQKFDIYKIDSNKGEYSVTYRIENKSYTSKLYIIKDPLNINFIKKYTMW